MKLNRTDNLLSREARIAENQNWQTIENNFNNVVETVSDKAYGEVVDAAKLNWKEPVASFANLPTTANTGDTMMTRDTGKVYRYNGTEFKEIQEIDAGPVNEVDSRLTSQLAQIAYSDVSKFVGDDSQKLNAFLDAHAGKTVRIPRGSYSISNTVIIPENTEVIAYGVNLACSAHITALDVKSSSIIRGVELVGFGYTTPNSLGRAFEIRGASAVERRENISIIDCKATNFGYYGILMEFAKNIDISHCHFENIGYAGIMGFSCEDVIVDRKTLVKNITGLSSNNNGYGVAFSRTTTSDDLTVYPRSKNCIVRDCVVEDVPTWEGLDTHAGENIQFLNNTIRNCKDGVSLVGAAGTLSPINCKVVGNKIYGNKTGTGVKVVGAGNLIGDPYSYAENNLIDGNYIENCGKDGAWDGGMLFYTTLGTTVVNNTINKCLIVGISPRDTNKAFVISNNTFIDIYNSPSYDYADCISIRDDYNSGVISGNMTLLINDTLGTLVMNRGIRAEKLDNSNITIGNNHLRGVSTPLSGMLGQQVEYLTVGVSMRIYASNGTPEGAIAANPGSICLNYAGGVGTTLFIKESGQGASGWVAK